MENETDREDPREEARELRDEAEFLEAEMIGLAAAAAVLESEADDLENDHPEIHSKVDGEPYETRKRELTTN